MTGLAMAAEINEKIYSYPKFKGIFSGISAILDFLIVHRDCCQQRKFPECFVIIFLAFCMFLKYGTIKRKLTSKV
jgi:hypothetical protein